jgi:hypothetical protein
LSAELESQKKKSEVELRTVQEKLERELLVAKHDIQKAQDYSNEFKLNEANNQIRSLIEEMTATTEELLQIRLSFSRKLN